MLTYFASQYRRFKAWFELRAENKLWDQRRSKALAKFDTDQRVWVEQALKNQETFQRQRFNDVIMRIELDDIIYSSAAVMLKKLDVFKQVIGIQALSGPCGLVFRMCPHYENGQEGDDSKKIGIKVTKTAVEASTKKLALRLNHVTLGAVSTPSPVISADELAEAFGAEAALEMAAEIIQNLKVIGGKQNAMERAFKEERIGDKVIIAINTIANKVAASTHRGAANFVICGPTGLAKLQLAGAPRFTAVSDLKTHDILTHAGYINDVIKVYVSIAVDDDSFIVGFNGASATDTGYILAPYVPLMITGPVTDPNTTFGTRYGVSLIPESPDMPVDSSSYYGVLRLKEAV